VPVDSVTVGRRPVEVRGTFTPVFPA
jgi:hypothetical protein